MPQKQMAYMYQMGRKTSIIHLRARLVCRCLRNLLRMRTG